MSWVWDGRNTAVQRRMGLAGWLVEDWFPIFSDAVDRATAFARYFGRLVKVVRDSEHVEPWQVCVR
jgi:hypothetical protein